MTELSVARLRELLNYDPETGRLTWKARKPSDFPGGAHTPEWSANQWNARYAGKGACCTPDGNKGYLRGMIKWRTYPAHRVAWALHYGEWPKGEIDHINRDMTDNRIANLRAVSTRQNCRNQGRHRNNTSGVSGVAYRKESGRWRAYINSETGRENLGTYASFEEAVAARSAALIKHGYDPTHGISD